MAKSLATHVGESYTDGMGALLGNRNFLLLLLTYGINVGAFYSLSTLLNSLVLDAFPVSFQI